jgi:serine protease AprX
MAKIVDYIVNKEHILWVTSAGNNGFIKPKEHYPFTSTMTVPAESYNAITVANMNMYAEDEFTEARKYMRATHAIRYTSSRGPTLIGRKKPDITAPGNDTYTCAPDPKKYGLHYSADMNYQDGYRLMGGTSSAAPHVGGAALLLQEAGITNPITIKALLINSADSWTDNKIPGPHDPDYDYKGGHHPQFGSEWNTTYGWGYMNMETAFYQRHNIIEGQLSLKQPLKEYKFKVLNKDKITLVHERRVGFSSNGSAWQLSHLTLQMFDAKSHRLLAEDSSAIDNVHQISICTAKKYKLCADLKYHDVIVIVRLKNSVLDGEAREAFALAYS